MSWIAAKLLVTAALVAWLAAEIDWAEFWSTLRRTNLWLLALVVPLRFASVWFSAIKWRELLAVHDVHYALSKLFGWYLTGTFISQFLPSTIGGDSYRVYKTYRNSKARVVSVLAVFADRLTSTMVALALGYAAALIVFLTTGDELAGTIVLLSSAAAVCSGVALTALLKADRMERFTESKYCPKPLASMIRHSRDYSEHRKEMRLVWLHSFLFQASRILATWLVLIALGWVTNPVELTFALVAVTTIGMLPISVAGLGVMEASFAYLMARYGVPIEAGVATMLLLRVQLIVVSAVGGVFFLLERKELHTEELAQADRAPRRRAVTAEP
jgi:hypothetical protein